MSNVMSRMHDLAQLWLKMQLRIEFLASDRSQRCLWRGVVIEKACFMWWCGKSIMPVLLYISSLLIQFILLYRDGKTCKFHFSCCRYWTRFVITRQFPDSSYLPKNGASILWSRLQDTVFISYRIDFILDWFHIGLFSYRVCLLFTRDHFDFISDWPPLYKRMHQSDTPRTGFALLNKNTLKMVWSQSDII